MKLNNKVANSIIDELNNHKVKALMFVILFLIFEIILYNFIETPYEQHRKVIVPNTTMSHMGLLLADGCISHTVEHTSSVLKKLIVVRSLCMRKDKTKESIVTTINEDNRVKSIEKSTYSPNGKIIKREKWDNDINNKVGGWIIIKSDE